MKNMEVHGKILGGKFSWTRGLWMTNWPGLWQTLVRIAGCAHPYLQLYYFTTLKTQIKAGWKRQALKSSCGKDQLQIRSCRPVRVGDVSNVKVYFPPIFHYIFVFITSSPKMQHKNFIWQSGLWLYTMINSLVFKGATKSYFAQFPQWTGTAGTQPGTQPGCCWERQQAGRNQERSMEAEVQSWDFPGVASHIGIKDSGRTSSLRSTNHQDSDPWQWSSSECLPFICWLEVPMLQTVGNWNSSLRSAGSWYHEMMQVHRNKSIFFLLER